MMLRERYLRRDERERIVETPGEMMDRVAAYVAAAEDAYHAGTSDVWGEEFARRLRALEFLPNSPTLMNAGTGIGVLSACFVLPVEDSLESIFATLGHAAVLHQAGAGTGFSFSRLRPAGDLVASTHGRSSGPVSFMRVYDLATEVIRQSGRRRGANMAVLDVSHPDIHEFITAKSVPGELEHFNLSVGVSDRFMHAALAGEMHDLVNPRTGRVVDHISAAQLLDLIASEAWNTGEPGLLFLDRINRSNPLPSSGRVEAPHPCGEVPLLPNESCNLGSINLAKFVDRDRRTVDWHGLRAITRVAVRFLDDVIDVNVYPTRILADAARETRKIGLGVMGLAELLAALGVPYDSDEAIDLGERVATCIHDEATKASAQLAAKRGAFPCFERSIYAAHACPPLRNAQLTAIAPTGTISLIAGTTSGIEPIFAIAYARNIMGEHLVESNQLFERIAREEG
ncbi:MAG: adenosylcobalamin-dependent ribonucleoside-diphosphate reductase, partial [Dehalococcoidia bacterium]